MGKVLQKKKNRSSLPKVKKRNTGRLKNGNKKIDVLGNAVIAANWDKKLTLSQNYRRLGLSSRLNAPTGGTEKKVSLLQSANGSKQLPNTSDPLHILDSTTSTTKTLKPTEARVERDPETGKILRIIQDDAGPNDDEIEVGGRKRRKANPLDDPLVDISAAASNDAGALAIENSASNDVIKALEAQAASEGEALKKKRPRYQSQREEEWLGRLVEKHGDDVAAMVRDRKLNPMQQTEGDIRRRLKKWREKHG